MQTAIEEGKTKKERLVLIAGGANFLGASLSKALLDQEFSVVCLDDLSHSSKSNIEDLLQNSRFTFQQEDFSSPSFKPSPQMNPSYVFHLASVGIHTPQEKPSLNTLLINSVGTKNLLDIAVEKKAKFIFLSSPEVFQAASPQTSLNSLFAKEVKTESLAFAEGKRFGELLIAEYFKKFDLDTVVVRIKDPYGPAMPLDAKSLMSSLIAQALEKGKIEILGDGLLTANPTFSSDIVDGLIKAAFSDTRGEIFQLINPDRYTEKAIAEQLKLIVGGVEIVQKKKTHIVDIGQPLILEETQEKLGWAPRTSLEEGLNRTVAFFRQEKTKELKKDEIKPQPAKSTLVKSSKKNLMWKGMVALLLAVFAWVLVFPIISIVTNIGAGQENLKEAVEKIEGLSEVEKALDFAKKAEAEFSTTQLSVKNIEWVGIIPWFSSSVKSTEGYLFLAENLAKAAKFTSLGNEKIKHANLPSTSSGVAKADLEKANMDFEQAVFLLETFSSISATEKDLPLNLGEALDNLKLQKEVLEKVLLKRQAELQSLL